MNRAEQRRQSREEYKKSVKTMVSNGTLEKVKEQGIEEGMLVSTAMVLTILNREYGFAANDKGTGRLDKFVDLFSAELKALGYTTDQSVLDKYIKTLQEKTGLAIEYTA